MSKRLKFASVGLGSLAALGLFTALTNQVQSGVISTKSIGSASPTSPNIAPSNTPNVKKISVVAPDPKRTVYLVGEVGTNALDLAAQITELGQQNDNPIYVVITSPGGSVLTGGQMIAAIEASKAPVYTVCNILCASMAAMIFEYGTERYIGDRSFLMFHPASGGASGELDKMVSRLLSMQRYIGKMEAFTGVRAGLTFENYKARSAVENWIDGEDAVNTGFADKIATVALPKNNPFSGLLGAQALYNAIFIKKNPTVTTSPSEFNWITTPADLQWLNSFTN